MSLSSRRAWIEIDKPFSFNALSIASLSSRRAWIEISDLSLPNLVVTCRSPRGERGLKSFCIPYDIYNLFVALLAESVD